MRFASLYVVYAACKRHLSKANDVPYRVQSLRAVAAPAAACNSAPHSAAPLCQLQLRTRMNIHVPGQGAKVQGQFQTDCKKAQEAALLCATTHPEERQRCDKFFAAYRECRKAEHSRILEARGQGR